MFEALVNKRIPTKNYEFDLLLADVEELNKKAKNAELDITKISIAVILILLRLTSLFLPALQLEQGNGPVLISKKKIYPDELQNLFDCHSGNSYNCEIAHVHYLSGGKKSQGIFISDIEEAVLSNERMQGLLFMRTVYIS